MTCPSCGRTSTVDGGGPFENVFLWIFMTWKGITSGPATPST